MADDSATENGIVPLWPTIMLRRSLAEHGAHEAALIKQDDIAVPSHHFEGGAVGRVEIYGCLSGTARDGHERIRLGL